MLHSNTNEGNISLIQLINSKQLWGVSPSQRCNWEFKSFVVRRSAVSWVATNK